MKRLHRALLAAVVFGGLCLNIQPLYAQATAPAYCVMAEVASSRDASEYLMSEVLHDLDYRTDRGPGANIYAQSQRLVGWLFYLYSTGDPAWRGEARAFDDLRVLTRGLIRNNGGTVPALVEEEMPNFRRALQQCVTPTSTRST